MKQGRLCAVLVLGLTAVLLAPAAADVISGKDIHKFFDKHDYKYTVKDEYNWWVLPYKGTGCGNFNVDVKYGRDYTYVMAYLFDVPTDCGRAFYVDLCRRNFELNQVKLSIDGDNRLWISYEIPNRILDWDELCSDIDTIACWYEDNYNGLKTAMTKWWDYDREAEFRPMYETPVSSGDVDEQAASHIRETSQRFESSSQDRSFDSSNNQINTEQIDVEAVTQEALKHIAETQPPMETMGPGYTPPVSNNADRPNASTNVKMPQRAVPNTAERSTVIAKAEMASERVAGVKQTLVKPNDSRQTAPVGSRAVNYGPNRPGKNVQAVIAPWPSVAPYPPVSVAIGTWHAKRPETGAGRSERVAGWTSRTSVAPGFNMVNRSGPKILCICNYEDKLMIH